MYISIMKKESTVGFDGMVAFFMLNGNKRDQNNQFSVFFMDFINK